MSDEPTAADGRVRVLVVDDSAFARKVMREVLASHPGIEVIGIARDGLEALEKIAEERPDVVTLDLVMPNLDGLGVLSALPAEGAPAVVVVSISGADSELGIRALQAGAMDIVEKPTALATDRLYSLGGRLVETVLAAAGARRPATFMVAPPAVSPEAQPPAISISHGTRLVVIGASTGGPQALTRIVTALPKHFPVPVALVLHIPPGYTEAFAKRLDDVSAVEVLEAHDGLELCPGRVVVARAGYHLKLDRREGRLLSRLDLEPIGTLHCPSVDVLFEAASAELGAGVLGVVLTGMGNDGLRGARAIHAAGGRLLTEAESTCVVYGMPRVVRDAGLSRAEAPISEMADLILNHL